MTTITISLPKTTAEKIDEKAKADGFATRSEFIRSLIRRYLANEIEPPYGSDEWWQWAEKKADEDIAARRYKIYKNVEGAIKDLRQGK